MTRRGQLIRLPEAEAKAKYPHLVIASLGANRKDRPNGEVTARVLHDGTNGLAIQAFLLSLRSTRQHRFALRQLWRHGSRKQKRFATPTTSGRTVLVATRNSSQEGPNQQSAKTRERGRRSRPTFARILLYEHGRRRDPETVARHSFLTCTQNQCFGSCFKSGNCETASAMAAAAEREC